MSKQRHWYDRRKRDDAPVAALEDQAYDNVAAWCKGYNDAVQAYVSELNATLRRELRDWREDY